MKAARTVAKITANSPVYSEDQISRVSIFSPKDLNRDTTAIAMIPPANPTLYREKPLWAK